MASVALALSWESSSALQWVTEVHPVMRRDHLRHVLLADLGLHQRAASPGLGDMHNFMDLFTLYRLGSNINNNMGIRVHPRHAVAAVSRLVVENPNLLTWLELTILHLMKNV